MNTEYSKSYGGVREALCQEVISKSFIFMVIALGITAFASVTVSPMVAFRMMSGPGFILLFIAEIAIVLISNNAIKKNNPVLAGVLFAIYAYLTGVTFSVLFVAYTSASIASAFIVTAVTFAIMAVYGMLTKSDLSKMGNILMMGLIGIILSGFINLILFRSTLFDTLISAVGVLIFVGLTAYDAQKIKQMVAYSNDENVLSLSLMGAFQLYLDFINMFLRILSLMGKNRD